MRRLRLTLAVSLLVASGACTVPRAGERPDDAAVTTCEESGDRDGDGVPDLLEDAFDSDDDGISDALELDGDDDGRPDALEAGDAPCAALPDLDGDGVPDLRDADGNGDGIVDRGQWASDLDDDGTPDGLDPDVDGDGIANTTEHDAGEPADTDGDGTPDVLDLDSDGDTISDRDEGAGDPDRDGILSFRDLDADGDGASDASEAGDAQLDTPPIECADEIDLATGERAPDGLFDALDFDRDGDGVSDGDELARAMDPCDPDSDDDGLGDLVEVARDRVECVLGTEDACGCAIDPDCGIPATDYYVVLPFGAPAIQRDLDFSTALRVADVFLLADTTGSMGVTLERIQDTVARPGGLVDRIRAHVPSAWLGGGHHDDFPLHLYGSGDDQVFGVAIEMVAPERAGDVAAAFAAMDLHIGGDYPESGTEALLHVATGRGGAWRRDGFFYTIPRFVDHCDGERWGAACFRPSALPIVVHFTDACSHQGPPGESAACADYDGFAPAPARWEDAIAAMRARAMRYVGINAGERRCEESSAPDGSSPCFFLHQTATATDTVDLDGRSLVYDMPQIGTSEDDFVDTVVGAIDTVARRIPFDVDTALRAGPSPRPEIDPRDFVRSRRPACRATPPAESCWRAGDGVPHDRAVGALDDDAFLDVVPGTDVVFRVELVNDVFRGGAHPEVFVTFIDVRGDAVTTLDTRAVYVVVPAAAAPD